MSKFKNTKTIKTNTKNTKNTKTIISKKSLSEDKYIQNILKKDKSLNKSHTSLLDNITLKKELGEGAFGKIYLAIDKKKNKYAYKIEKIVKEHIKKTSKSNYWREIEFNENIAKKYPDQFMTLYDYKIQYPCDYQNNSTLANVRFKQHLINDKINKKKSTYCGIKLWSLVDGIIKKLLLSNKISNCVYYDLLIQIINIIYILDKNNYKHSDLHPSNIAYINTDKEYIKILNKQIPTHGYIIKIIDYGSIRNKTYDLNKFEKHMFENYTDLMTIFSIYFINYSLTDFQHYYKNDNEWQSKVTMDLISKKDKEILKLLLPSILPDGNKMSKEIENYMILKMYILIYYEKWQIQVLGDKFKKIIPLNLIVPLNVILYFVKNIYNVPAVLEYFLENRDINTKNCKKYTVS